MRWKRRRQQEEARADEASTHEARTLNRLRGIAETEHPSRDHDAKEIEARIRNLNYGTNRE